MRFFAVLHSLIWICGLAGGLVTGRIAAAAQPIHKSIEAYAGKPFGVGRVDIEFPAGSSLALPPEAPCWLGEKTGRVLYPVCETAAVQTGIDNARNQVDRISGWFVFRGDQPLNVTLDAGTEFFRMQATPETNATAHGRLLKEWWSHTSQRTLALSQSELHPLQVENYLVPMLSRRLALAAPPISQSLTGRRDTDMILGTLIGTESVRLAMQKEATLGRANSNETASESLPEAISPPPVTIPEVPKDLEIEAIARHVPQECFYIRCRTMGNYRWLRENLDRWGANARDLASVRAVDYGIRDHLEKQLGLKEGLLARLFGSLVVKDVAFIGSDTFFREGSAAGILFQSTSSPILGNQIKLQRRGVLTDRPETAETTVTLGGHSVSMIESPDRSVRSYYAVDGAFHLITNSETIARRFFEAGAGKRSLGELQEFRHARNLLPLSRDDNLFVYFSDPFFNQLVSPAYRVEMTRRMLAEADLEVLTLARLAALAEKQPASSVEELIAGGFLPQDFGKRPDSSHPVLLPDGHVRDSLRGARRSFLPIPDIAISRVTPTEQKGYQEFARLYQGIWQRMDPVALAVRWENDSQQPEREHVVFDLHVSPLAREPYGSLARFLGKPDRKKLSSIPGDLIHAEALTAFVNRWTIPIFRNFIGARDTTLPFSISRGNVGFPFLGGKPDRWLENLPIYLAGQRIALRGKQPGQQDNFPTPDHPQDTTVQTTSPFFGSFWHRWNKDFELISPDEKLPATVLPLLKLEKGARPAQVRLGIADLEPSRIAGLLQAIGYCRSRQSSQSNVNLLHSLIQQLHIEPDQALLVYRDILAGEPTCPLGGTYVRHETGPGPVRWRSTAWQHDFLSQVASAPKEYRSPLLTWFHGLELEFTVDAQASVLTTHLEVDLLPTIGK